MQLSSFQPRIDPRSLHSRSTQSPNPILGRQPSSLQSTSSRERPSSSFERSQPHSSGERLSSSDLQEIEQEIFSSIDSDKLINTDQRIDKLSKELSTAMPLSITRTFFSRDMSKPLQKANQLLLELQSRYDSIGSPQEYILEATDDFKKVVGSEPPGGGYAVTSRERRNYEKKVVVYVSLDKMNDWLKKGELGNLMNTIRHEYQHAKQKLAPDYESRYQSNDDLRELEAYCHEMRSTLKFAKANDNALTDTGSLLREPVATESELDLPIQNAYRHAYSQEDKTDRALKYGNPPDAIHFVDKSLCLLAQDVYRQEGTPFQAIRQADANPKLKGALLRLLDDMEKHYPVLTEAYNEGIINRDVIASKSAFELCDTIQELAEVAKWPLRSTFSQPSLSQSEQRSSSLIDSAPKTTSQNFNLIDFSD